MRGSWSEGRGRRHHPDPQRSRSSQAPSASLSRHLSLCGPCSAATATATGKPAVSTTTASLPMVARAATIGARWSSSSCDTSRITGSARMLDRCDQRVVLLLRSGQLRRCRGEGGLECDDIASTLVDRRRRCLKRFSEGSFGATDVRMVPGGQEERRQPARKRPRQPGDRNRDADVVGDLLGAHAAAVVQGLLDAGTRAAIHLCHRVEVSLTEGRPLPDLRGRRTGGSYRVLPVAGERGSLVVHDRAVVVRPDVVTIGDVLVEVVLTTGLDVLPVDGDELVAILTALLVPQADGVADLVDAAPGVTAGAHRDVLPTGPAHADLRRASGAVKEAHEVREARGVGRRPQDEPDDGVLFPVRNGVLHPLLVRHRRVDLVRHLSTGPPELAPRQDDALFEAFATHRGSRRLDLLDTTEVDIPFEDGPTVDHGVLDCLRPERQARDDRGADLR